MRSMKIAAVVVFATGTFLGLALTSLSQATQPRSSAAVKQVGAIKSIAGTVIVLAPDSGAEVNVLVQSSTRLVRIAPGEKDLKNAVPIALSDLQPGDRILVRGKSGHGDQLVASGIIAMKLSQLQARQQQEREDWQKRGVAGLVSAVDSSAGNIIVSIGPVADKKTVSIHSTANTIVRRYAPDSVHFDDARPATLAQIRPGDQLRARGTRSADGSEFAAEEIVAGSFRNIAGSVSSVDASSGAITVLDLATKKPVVVKVTADSQLRSLPPEMARHMAMGLVTGGGASAAANPNGVPAARREAMGERPEGPMGAPPRRGDMQQMFNHLPSLSLAAVQKGDTVMLVATEGDTAGAVTAIKLLDGVEAILAATAKNGAQTMTLSPWSLGGQGGEEENP